MFSRVTVCAFLIAFSLFLIIHHLRGEDYSIVHFMWELVESPRGTGKTGGCIVVLSKAEGTQTKP